MRTLGGFLHSLAALHRRAEQIVQRVGVADGLTKLKSPSTALPPTPPKKILLPKYYRRFANLGHELLRR